MYASAFDVLRGCSAAFHAPRRTPVSVAAAETLMIHQPGGYSGPWSAEETPYMVEPMNMMASREHEAEVFVGPARTGKTMALLDGFTAFAVRYDPGDTLVVQMSQDKAREFSQSRIDRAIKNSPRLQEMLGQRKHDDNVHDKTFLNGMRLKIGWPSTSQLASTDYRYVLLTDYDRMPDDIGGEGSAFILGLKRTQTFFSRGMCVVESSPGRELTDPNWQPATPHEAPPCTGILGIYNTSDRRRWYWRCPNCGAWFEARPGLGLFSTLPSEDELLQMVRTEDLPKLAAHHARVICPATGCILEHTQKRALNRAGRWLADGQRMVGDRLEGQAQRSSIAGYWLGGVAAAYQSWSSLLLRYLQGLREYELSGSEETLKTTTNTDQGVPFMSRAIRRASEQRPVDRAEDLPRYFVPDAARFLIASVDVQGGQNRRLVVTVKAFGPGMEGWIVDRKEIRESPRGKKAAPVQIDPGAYPEDWDAITEQVVKATYRTSDPERELRVLLTVVDTGGEDGVTPNAYAWYRRVKKAGLGDRVMLIAGAAKKPEAPVLKANARDARGLPMRDVQLYHLDTDFFKDVISASLKRTEPGPGYMHFPKWLPQHVYEELAAEVRQANGKWKKLRARNEQLDLWVYVLAGCWKLQVHRIDWNDPPAWARPLALNSESVSAEIRREMQAEKKAAAQDRDADLFQPIAI
jgi:phage terminase large subunit GpA-like protein